MAMEIAFYVSGAVAVFATAMALTRLNAVHALLYLVVSLLAVAVVFFVLGAPFIAALEVIVYAGAIMVLFVFVIMILNLGPQAIDQEHRRLSPGMWVGPSILAALLLAELFFVFLRGRSELFPAGAIPPQAVGAALFGPYLLGVELASVLLMGGLVGAYHLGRRGKPETAGSARGR